MSSRPQPKGYTTMQITLHWVIAALVFFQLVFGEDIVPAFRAFMRGDEPGADDLFAANLHVYAGVAIFVLAIWRLALRLRYGAPPPPPGEKRIQQIIAGAAHVILYLAIFLMPISGSVAWFLGIGEAGEVHELGKPVLIIVIALHAAGALWQHFGAKTDVLMRMLKPVRA